MLDECDLVEDGALDARDLTGVVVATALLEPFERLPLPSRLAQGVATGVDLGVVTVEVERARLTRLSDTLEVGLVGDQLARIDGSRGSGPLRGERARELLAGHPQAIGAARPPGHRPGQLLLGEILAALAQGTQALEGKAKRAHGRGSRRRPPELERLDEYSSGLVASAAAGRLTV